MDCKYQVRTLGEHNHDFGYLVKETVHELGTDNSKSTVPLSEDPVVKLSKDLTKTRTLI